MRPVAAYRRLRDAIVTEVVVRLLLRDPHHGEVLPTIGARVRDADEDLAVGRDHHARRVGTGPGALGDDATIVVVIIVVVVIVIPERPVTGAAGQVPREDDLVGTRSGGDHHPVAVVHGHRAVSAQGNVGDDLAAGERRVRGAPAQQAGDRQLAPRHAERRDPAVRRDGGPGLGLGDAGHTRHPGGAERAVQRARSRTCHPGRGDEHEHDTRRYSPQPHATQSRRCPRTLQPFLRQLWLTSHLTCLEARGAGKGGIVPRKRNRRSRCVDCRRS